MSTLVRPNISKKNRYYISRHRFYELKHFCLQYPEWQKERLSYLRPESRSVITTSKLLSDPTPEQAIALESVTAKIKLVDDAIALTDPELSSWLAKAVCYGVTFSALIGLYGIPCSRDTFYDRYRKFYYILSCLKDAPREKSSI